MSIIRPSKVTYVFDFFDKILVCFTSPLPISFESFALGERWENVKRVLMASLSQQGQTHQFSYSIAHVVCALLVQPRIASATEHQSCPLPLSYILVPT